VAKSPRRGVKSSRRTGIIASARSLILPTPRLLGSADSQVGSASANDRLRASHGVMCGAQRFDDRSRTLAPAARSAPLHTVSSRRCMRSSHLCTLPSRLDSQSSPLCRPQGAVGPQPGAPVSRPAPRSAREGSLY